MKRPWLTALGIGVSGVLAVGVCVVGYKANSANQTKQNITYAKSSIKQETNRLPKVQKEVAALYQDSNKDILQAGLTEKMLADVKADVNNLKTSGEDFGISDSDVPDTAQTLAQAKESLTADLNDVSNKLMIQTAMNKLFTTDVANWPSFVDDVVIKKDLKVSKTISIREEVNEVTEGSWRTIATQYLDSAKGQLDQIKTVEDLLDKLVKEGKLTDTATYADYNDLVDAVAAIKNPDLNTKYQAQADEAATLIGETTAATTATSESTTSTYTAPSTTYSAADDTTAYGTITDSATTTYGAADTTTAYDTTTDAATYGATDSVQ